MIGDTCREYIDNEVVPNLDALENHAWEIARDLLKKAGDLGLLGANIPEEYGGMALDQTSGVIIAEMVGRGSGFGSTYGAQTGRSACFRSSTGAARKPETGMDTEDHLRRGQFRHTA